MNGQEYREAAAQFIAYPDSVEGKYLLTALIGEIGEVANQVKKIMRDDNSVLTPERREKLIDELGDVTWYMAVLSRHMIIDAPEYNQHSSIVFNMTWFTNTLFEAIEELNRILVGSRFHHWNLDSGEHAHFRTLSFQIERLIRLIGATPNEVFEQNINKLKNRAAANTIKGDKRDG